MKGFEQMLKRYVTTAVTAVLVASGLAGSLPGTATDTPTKTESAAFAVASGKTLQSVESVIAATGTTLVEARYTFSAVGQVLTVGVPGNGSLADDGSIVLDTLNDLQVRASEAAKQDPGLLKTDPTLQLVAAARTDLSKTPPVPSQVTLTGDLSQVESEVLVGAQVPPTTNPATAKSSQSAAACGSTWWPTYVTGTSGPASSGGRSQLFYLRFSLTTLAAFKCLGSTAFEPDFVTYNYDNAYYFADSMLSWSSTMPSPYWDTNAFDASSERVYTVGSQNINGFISGTQYSVYFRMNNGNAASDTAKIVWQRSHYQAACPLGPAWCIFADASKIQYAWSITVPGPWAP